jgi:hypothetical protein
LRLVVAIPCYDTIARETALSLAMMAFRIGQSPPPDLEWYGMEWRSSSNLPEQRHELAKRALKLRNATHILWVDSDMGFPPDSLHRLLAHDLDIVGANYPRRVRPYWSSASDLDGKVLDPSSVGLQEVGVIGFGLVLTKRCVFEAEYEMPLFAHHDEGGYCTEDVAFCRKVRKTGFKVWVDHDLSRDVRHVGSLALTYDDMEPG